MLSPDPIKENKNETATAENFHSDKETATAENSHSDRESVDINEILKEFMTASQLSKASLIKMFEQAKMLPPKVVFDLADEDVVSKKVPSKWLYYTISLTANFEIPKINNALRKDFDQSDLLRLLSTIQKDRFLDNDAISKLRSKVSDYYRSLSKPALNSVNIAAQKERKQLRDIQFSKERSSNKRTYQPGVFTQTENVMVHNNRTITLYNNVIQNLQVEVAKLKSTIAARVSTKAAVAESLNYIKSEIGKVNKATKEYNLKYNELAKQKPAMHDIINNTRSEKAIAFKLSNTYDQDLMNFVIAYDRLLSVTIISPMYGVSNEIDAIQEQKRMDGFALTELGVAMSKLTEVNKKIERMVS